MIKSYTTLILNVTTSLTELEYPIRTDLTLSLTDNKVGQTSRLQSKLFKHIHPPQL